MSVELTCLSLSWYTANVNRSFSVLSFNCKTQQKQNLITGAGHQSLQNIAFHPVSSHYFMTIYQAAFLTD